MTHTPDQEDVHRRGVTMDAPSPKGQTDGVGAIGVQGKVTQGFDIQAECLRKHGKGTRQQLLVGGIERGDNDDYGNGDRAKGGLAGEERQPHLLRLCCLAGS